MARQITTSENRLEPSDTVPLASFEIQPAASYELVFVRMMPIEPQLAVGRRVYALNVEQAAALRDRLDDAERLLRRELRAAEHTR
jgi:hypothetical protein